MVRARGPAAAGRMPPRSKTKKMDNQRRDLHGQLRALYRSLLERQSHFDEFKQLLALYPPAIAEDADEPDVAAQIRERLNTRIADWLDGDFDGLSVMQVLQWRTIVVEEHFNVVLSPWNESSFW
jgi:hypothetical protein